MIRNGDLIHIPLQFQIRTTDGFDREDHLTVRCSQLASVASIIAARDHDTKAFVSAEHERLVSQEIKSSDDFKTRIAADQSYAAKFFQFLTTN